MMETAFREAWIDFPPRAGKRDGAFCSSSRTLGRSWILTSYGGTIGSVKTMAHELGHFLFHNSQNTAYAYMEKGSRLPSDVDPERQADIFAAELLIPLHLIGDKNVYQVQKHFGVSRSAARAQMMHATKVRKRHEHKTHIKEKRPSPEQLNR
jgi:hypothetical protein